MLTSAELATMRDTVEDTFDRTCSIAPGDLQPDGAGGWILDPDAEAVTVPCRVAPFAGGGREFEAVDGERIAMSVPWVITLPAGTTLTGRAWITSEGTTFEVSAPLVPRSQELAVRVICRLVE